MRVVFRRSAEVDLRRIVDWFEEMAPDSVARILDDIYRSIDLLIDFPRTGMPVVETPFRRIVTRRYHFKIAYQILGETIAIVGIYRFEDRST